MKRFLFLCALVCTMCCLSNEASAQTYTAAGIRLGSPISASFKFFPGGGSNAIEAFVGYRSQRNNIFGTDFGWTSINIGGLYQVHKPLEIGDIEGLQYYFGGGASAIIWSYDDGFPGSDDYGSVSFGVLGNVGLDYTFEDTPINISLDWMPRVFLGNGFDTGLGFGYGALSVRYIIGRG